MKPRIKYYAQGGIIINAKFHLTIEKKNTNR